MRIVLDDEQYGVARLEIVSGRRRSARPCAPATRSWQRSNARWRVLGSRLGRRGRGAGIILRQEKRERRAHARRRRSWISPPSSLASSRLMARPRPVPPYLRLVLASACWKASKMIFCFSGGMPMPVSATSKAITVGAWLRIGCRGSSRSPPQSVSRTPPFSVNLKALDNRFFSTCCRRLESVTMLRPRLGSSSSSNDSCAPSASWRNGRATVSRRFER